MERVCKWCGLKYVRKVNHKKFCTAFALASLQQGDRTWDMMGGVQGVGDQTEMGSFGEEWKG